ncbi:hypothetical protein LCGC14_0622750 [marine sediment metagenome]|uniref:Uncharacterized protein n=1 Tax=marine sediment metagenome TaxID=412755 RepID=A0A0F9R9E7_9ZZZZ
MGNARLTREEMWTAIKKKYPTLNIFTINSSFSGGTHVKREFVVAILREMNIHKSIHLSRDQKRRLNLELIDKL